MKLLKLYNGGDWLCRGGHLYVAAHSVRDACILVNEAYCKLQGYENRPDIQILKPGEMRTYWATGCWGNAMDGITPERGVWWKPHSRNNDEKVRRMI